MKTENSPLEKATAHIPAWLFRILAEYHIQTWKTFSWQWFCCQPGYCSSRHCGLRKGQPRQYDRRTSEPRASGSRQYGKQHTLKAYWQPFGKPCWQAAFIPDVLTHRLLQGADNLSATVSGPSSIKLRHHHCKGTHYHLRFRYLRSAGKQHRLHRKTLPVHKGRYVTARLPNVI